MMPRAAPLAGVAASLLFGIGVKAAEREPMVRFAQQQRDYIVACAGCHGLDGQSNAELVPTLKGLVGYYLYMPEGRAYLPRLPNVAFSTLDDRRLAAVLNYMVFDLGADSAPVDAKPYRPAEVGIWRKRPLTEVALSQYRRGLVETLITQYQASTTMRVYGEDLYREVK
jgi:mono/diheme cytochrome c family protein